MEEVAVECSSGDLIASWYFDLHKGDSAVLGSRKRRGETGWSAPFVLADRPGFDQDEFIDDIPFPETQNYVKRILGTAEDYRILYGHLRPTR